MAFSRSAFARPGRPVHVHRMGELHMEGLRGRARRHRPPAFNEKVFENNRAATRVHDATGDIETDALDVAALNSAPGRLTDTGLRRRRPLRKALTVPPLGDFTSDVHVDHDSNRNLVGPEDSTSMTAIAFTRLPSMDDDRLTPEMAERVIGLIKEQMATRFAPPPGKKSFPGGQRVIAEKMHIAQPTLNRLILKGEGVGLDTVLGLRAYFRDIGHPMTIDEILWQHDPGQVRVSDDVALRLQQLEDRVKQFVEHPPSKKDARQYWKEVYELRTKVTGTIARRRKVASQQTAADDLPAEEYEGEMDAEVKTG